jgi:hypothetical protein
MVQIAKSVKAIFLDVFLSFIHSDNAQRIFNRMQQPTALQIPQHINLVTNKSVENSLHTFGLEYTIFCFKFGCRSSTPPINVFNIYLTQLNVIPYIPGALVS